MSNQSVLIFSLFTAAQILSCFSSIYITSADWHSLKNDHIFDHRQAWSTRKQRIQDRRRGFAVERKRL